MDKRIEGQSSEGICNLRAKTNGKVSREHRPLGSRSCVHSRLEIKKELPVDGACKGYVQKCNSDEVLRVLLALF